MNSSRVPVCDLLFIVWSVIVPVIMIPVVLWVTRNNSQARRLLFFTAGLFLLEMWALLANRTLQNSENASPVAIFLWTVVVLNGIGVMGCRWLGLHIVSKVQFRSIVRPDCHQQWALCLKILIFTDFCVDLTPLSLSLSLSASAESIEFLSLAFQMACETMSMIILLQSNSVLIVAVSLVFKCVPGPVHICL
jgi:hypothetical protein